jgi:hypothetical protein
MRVSNICDALNEVGERMSFHLQIEQRSGYLGARLTGAGDVEEAGRRFEIIIEHCKRTKNKRLLVDIRGVEGGFSFLDKYYLVGKLGLPASYLVKVATVNTQEKIDPRRFGELVAHNRGLNLRAFTDYETAEKWLLE